jgi:hypothetical protein
MVRTRIRVEYFYDSDTRRWDYVVPELNIVGGGGATKVDAAQRAAEAIAFALGGSEPDRPGSADVDYLPLVIG